MKKIFLYNIWFVLLTSFVVAQNHAPVVENVTFVQKTDGSFMVDIYYDVTDADGNAMAVSMKVSNDAGQTWDFKCDSIKGNIGNGIVSGTGKHIVWDFGKEHQNYFSDKIQIKIIADDGINEPGTPCVGTPTVTYEGKTYNTVQVGTQCWLRENLDVGVYVASTSTGSVHSDVSNNGTIEKYCYKNNEANCATYGGLYDWNEAMAYSTTPGTKGICPSGWHIPTKTEFETLMASVGNDGNKLKREDQGTGSGVGTNTSGFSALLAGSRGNGGGFYDLGGNAGFWSSTEGSASYAVNVYLWSSDSGIGMYGNYKEYGFSIRCLKD